MTLLPRAARLALMATLDIALHARARPVSSKQLATRYNLPPRRLETLLQALVRAGVLKSVRGPLGGYELARERRRLTLAEIVRVALRAEEEDNPSTASPGEQSLSIVLEQIEAGLFQCLEQVTLDELNARAFAAGCAEKHDNENDFAI